MALANGTVNVEGVEEVTFCPEHQECRDTIRDTKVRVDGHDMELAQTNAKLDGMEERLTARLDSIDQRLTTWVNPIVSVIITIMGIMLGFSGGVIAMLWRG